MHSVLIKRKARRRQDEDKRTTTRGEEDIAYHGDARCGGVETSKATRAFTSVRAIARGATRGDVEREREGQRERKRERERRKKKEKVSKNRSMCVRRAAWSWPCRGYSDCV